MRVALSMRVVNAEGYVEPRDAIAHDWLIWLEAQGAVGLPVPNRLADPAGYLDALDVDLLVLTGGNDLVPGGPGETGLSEARTRTERALLARALERGLPVLGVCRGMHVLNRQFGGTVRPHLDPAQGWLPHVAHDHEVRLEPPLSVLAGGDRVVTNSFHSQGIAVDDLAEPLLPLAAASDGAVEALAHRERPLLGIQWHPERPSPAGALDAVLFRRLLDDGPFWR